MKQTLTYLLIVFLCFSCKIDDATPDCSAVLCEEPNLTINLIDSETYINVILQDNIEAESIVIKNASENVMPFSISESNGILYIAKRNTSDTLEIQINSEIVATISYDTTAPKTNECCDFGILTDVDIEGLSYVVENNLITIYI